MTIRQTCLLITLLFTTCMLGCTLNLNEGHTNRLVKHLLKSEQNPVAYNSVQAVNDARDGTLLARYNLMVRNSNAQASEFIGPHKGMVYAVWDGKATIIDASQGVQDTILNLPTFNLAERKANLEVVARALLTNNDVVVSTGVKQRNLKCTKLDIEPTVACALWFGNTSFFEEDTGATVLMRQDGMDGGLSHTINLETLNAKPPANCTPHLPKQPTQRLFTFVPSGQGHPAPTPAPQAGLPILGAPRYQRSGRVDCYDFTKNGQMLALFRREASGPSLISPLALTTAIRGQTMRFWWVGNRYYFVRWSTPQYEYTILSNLPPNMVETFIKSNAKWLGLQGR